MFKKIVLALTLVMSLFITAPKAKAGLGIGYLVGAPGPGAAIGAATLGGLILAFSLANLDDEESWIYLYFGTPLYAGIGAILDVDASLPNDELQLAFQEQYPFIDNHEALANLVGTVKSKFSHIVKADPSTVKAYITFTGEEVAAALETADISETQFEQIVNDLK